MYKCWTLALDGVKVNVLPIVSALVAHWFDPRCLKNNLRIFYVHDNVELHIHIATYVAFKVQL